MAIAARHGLGTDPVHPLGGSNLVTAIGAEMRVVKPVQHDLALAAASH